MIRSILVFCLLALASSVQAEPPTRLDRALLQRIQTVRKEHGLRALTTDERLTKTAQAHADEMAEEGYFGHQSPHADHAFPEDRAEKGGYDWGVVRENLFKSPTAESDKFVEEAFKLWLDSKHHRDNLLHKDIVHIGVGTSTLKSGETSVVILLGREQ